MCSWIMRSSRYSAELLFEWLRLLDAHRRKLILVVQTHGSSSKLMFWNNFSFLGTSIFRVACAQERQRRRRRKKTPNKSLELAPGLGNDLE